MEKPQFIKVVVTDRKYFPASDDGKPELYRVTGVDAGGTEWTFRGYTRTKNQRKRVNRALMALEVGTKFSEFDEVELGTPCTFKVALNSHTGNKEVAAVLHPSRERQTEIDLEIYGEKE